MAARSKGCSKNPIALLLLLLLFLSSSSLNSSRGQQQEISTACTSSLISSFTPCFNFLTGSSNGGGGNSLTAQCCGSLASLVSNSMQCACLILTGNIPVSLPFNRTLSISLPSLCKSTSVPLNCSSAVGAPLPAPGPITYAPSLPPLPPLPAVDVGSPPPSITSSKSPPAITSPPSSLGKQRPLILPNSASKISTVRSLPYFLISLVLLRH